MSKQAGNIENKGEDPFFILGVPRSGTSLLAVLLGTHSQIYIPQKSYLSRFLQLREQLYREKILGSVDSSSSAIRKIERLKNRFEKERIEIDNLGSRKNINNALSKWASNKGKRIWGDKAPPFIDSLDRILLLFPNARIIHIIRDPRANALSLNKRQYMDLYDAAVYWRHLNTRGIADGSLIGSEQYLSVKYEELLQNPQKTLTVICEFIKIDYEESMIEKLLDSTKKGQYVTNKIDALKIDDWKTKLSKKNIKKIEIATGQSLTSFGYSPLVLTESQLICSPSFSRRELIAKIKTAWINFLAKEKEIMMGRTIEIVKYSLLKRMKNISSSLVDIILNQDFKNFIKGRNHTNK